MKLSCTYSTLWPLCSIHKWIYIFCSFHILSHTIRSSLLVLSIYLPPHKTHSISHPFSFHFLTPPICKQSFPFTSIPILYPSIHTHSHARSIYNRLHSCNNIAGWFDYNQRIHPVHYARCMRGCARVSVCWCDVIWLGMEWHGMACQREIVCQQR